MEVKPFHFRRVHDGIVRDIPGLACSAEFMAFVATIWSFSDLAQAAGIG